MRGAVKPVYSATADLEDRVTGSRLVALTSTMLLLGADLAFAHPGHGESGQGGTAKHYLTEPLHLVPWLLIAVLAVSVRVYRRRRNARRP